MFEVRSESHFSSAHKLIGYDGPCENLHGHNWHVRATVRCTQLNEIGIAIDFKKLKGALKKVCDELDHLDLNTRFTGPSQNPSSEIIAKYISDRIAEMIADEKYCRMHRVDVFETAGNCASYLADA